MRTGRPNQNTLLGVLSVWLRNWRFWACLIPVGILAYVVPTILKIPVAIAVFGGLAAVALKPGTADPVRNPVDLQGNKSLLCWLQLGDSKASTASLRWRQVRIQCSAEGLLWRPYWAVFGRRRTIVDSLSSVRILSTPIDIPIKPSARREAVCYELVGGESSGLVVAVGLAGTALGVLLEEMQKDQREM